MVLLSLWLWVPSGQHGMHAHAMDAVTASGHIAGASSGSSVLPPACTEEQHAAIIVEAGGNTRSFVDLKAEILPGGEGTFCRIDFGDGATSKECDPPAHYYQETASYKVMLEATTQCGNTLIQSLTLSIEVEEDPVEEGAEDDPSGAGDPGTCQPFLSGIWISEFLPNPEGDEAEGEWIELANDNAFPVTLCGFVLDDEEGGSKPYALDEVTIPAQSFLLLPRNLTGIALNNDDDQVRLLAPANPGSDELLLLASVGYGKAPEGSSYTSADGGMNYRWTTEPTPNAAAIPLPPRLPPPRVVIASALPNPAGPDAGNEWIELFSLAGEEIDLAGFSLVRATQRSTLGALSLPPRTLIRLSGDELGLTLPNSGGEVVLLDPYDAFVASLSWESSSEGEPVRHALPQGSVIRSTVANVEDGSTLSIVPLDPPDSFAMYNSLKVRLLGVKAPPLISDDPDMRHHAKEARDELRALIQGEEAELQFDTITWDKEGNLLAYLRLPGGQGIQQEMVRTGFLSADEAVEHTKRGEFLSLQQEAKSEGVGIWKEDEEDEEEAEETEDAEETEEAEVEESDDETGVQSTLPAQDEDEEDFSSYGRAEVMITEVYARPKKGVEEDEEWLEVVNIGTSEAHLGGISLEDVALVKSRVFVFPQGFLLQEGERRALPKTLTKLSLNDGGQELVLRDPLGEEIQRFNYPSVKEGYAYAFDGDEWCLTSVPTPGAVNALCTAATEPAIARKSSNAAKASTVGVAAPSTPALSALSALKIKYRNVVAREEDEGRSQEQSRAFSGVFAGMNMMKGETQSIHESNASIGQSYDKLGTVGCLIVIGLTFVAIGSTKSRLREGRKSVA